jgi:hypothetical protein
MAKRKTLLLGTTAGAAACALILACSHTASSGSSSNDDPTPPGTTPVTSAPYPVCVPLEPGSFIASGSYAVPATTSCSPAGEPTPGVADAHCVGVTPQAISGAACDDMNAGSGGAGGSAPTADAGPAPTPGPCDENGTDGAYGSTMYGTEADDDDCKYHLSYTVSPVCENSGTYFVVKASYLAGTMGPLTGASTFAELCLNDTHPGPAVDARPPYGNQQVVEGPPGTYTVGPVQFDASGDWTVRFHFNEFCCDVVPNSPHGHAAFHVTVP